MRTLVRRATRALVVCSILSLAVAAGALGARTGGYKGTTSQRQHVSFRLSGGAVQSFTIVVLDKCPDGHTLILTSNYPRMPITGGSFGGDFAPRRGHPGEHATLSGKVGRKQVTGRLQDTSYSSREHRLCHGSARFSAKHA